MSLYEESRPRSRYLLQARSPAIRQTIGRVQIVGESDEGSVLLHSKLENAQFLGATLARQHWVNVEIVTSEISATEFVECVLSHVQFQQSTLKEVTFRRCFIENLKIVSDTPDTIVFESCTILDPEGNLARFSREGRVRECVVPTEEELRPRVEPKKAVAPVARSAAITPAPVVKDEKKAEPIAPSRFDKLEV